jgi:hypothetical protein
MTLLVALTLATAVKLRPVLASPATSGKKRLTMLIGTITLRGSVESDACVEPLAGDGDCPLAFSERASIATLNTAANFVSLNPFCISLIFTLAH